MLISTIVLLVVRLFSVQWLVQGLGLLAITFTEVTGVQGNSLILLKFVPPSLAILFATAAWVTAPFLARIIPGKQDATVAISGLSLRDLHAFAFVFLGLYFALSSLADMLNWFHYFLSIAASRGDFDPQRQTSFYELSRRVITFIAGLVCIFYARRWARTLADAKQDS